MKINITGGTLIAEIQGNPIEKIQTQLNNAIQQQEEYSEDMTSQIDESVNRIRNIDKILAKYHNDRELSKQAYDKSQSDIKALQDELDKAVETLLANDESNPSIMALKEKSRTLMAAISQERSKSKALRIMVDEISERKPITRITKKITNVTNINKTNKITKVIVKHVTPDESIQKLHATINNVTRKRIPASRYLGKLPTMREESRIRQSIARAGVSPHSSKSNMQDKLNAQPRMPI